MRCRLPVCATEPRDRSGLRSCVLAVDRNSIATFLPANTADTWPHLGLCIGMAAPDLTLGRRDELTTHGRAPAPLGSVTAGR